MCLNIIKGQEPLRAEANIVVYKAVRIGPDGAVYPWMVTNNFRYKPGVIHVRPVEKMDEVLPCILDAKDENNLRKWLREHPGGKLEGVKGGFSFAFDPDRVATLSGYDTILRFRVPVGAVYYRGLDPRLGLASMIELIDDEDNRVKIARAMERGAGWHKYVLAPAV